MAKGQKIPTLDEMLEYNKRVNADIENLVRDADHRVMLKEMTLRIFSVEMNDDLKVTAWKFCKTLANFAHAPVSLAEYKRMQKWLGETALIDVLIKALNDYFPDETKEFYSIDTVGFYYSIALISQSKYRRTDCLKILEDLTDFFINTECDRSVILRNMTKLVKDYPDLESFKNKLESI